MKHKWNMNYIHEGKTYKSINGIVDLPVRVEKLNPIGDNTDTIDEKIFNSEKDELVDKAHELGLGSPSTLKRLSIETLKERIEEAN